MSATNCPHCDATLAAQDIAEGRCRRCGKEITPQVNPDSADIKAADEIPTLREYSALQDERLQQPQQPRRTGSGIRCPNCGSGSLSPGPWPWYLGTVGAMICRAVVCNECEHHFDANKPHANLATRKRNLALIINGIGLLGILAVIGGLVLWIWWVVVKEMRL
jgi:hypothetical protein